MCPENRPCVRQIRTGTVADESSYMALHRVHYGWAITARFRGLCRHTHPRVDGTVGDGDFRRHLTYIPCRLDCDSGCLVAAHRRQVTEVPTNDPLTTLEQAWLCWGDLSEKFQAWLVALALTCHPI